jgi:hypothetical protein
MTFPTNNLPTQSKFWGREVEKKITNLEGSFKSAEINNTTRDSQLSVTANQAFTAATQANTAATQAQQAINEIVDLGSPGGPTINASNISGGSISGVTFNTTGGTESLTLSAGKINFFEGGSGIGSMAADTDGSNDYIQISSNSGVGQLTVGSDYSVLSGDGCAVQPGVAAPGRIDLTATTVFCNAELDVTGSLDVTGGLSVGGTFSPASISTGTVTASGTVSGNTISGTTVSASGTVSGGSVSGGSISNSGSYTGNGFPSIRDNTVSGTTTFAPNVFISASSGNMARNTTMSERRAKENIQELDFDTDSFISINPVTFNYKREAVSDDEQAEAVNLGFILDDFEDVGLDEFLVAEPFEGDEYKQLRYNLLYMYLHKVVQKQQETIQDLTGRIEALESR